MHLKTFNNEDVNFCLTMFFVLSFVFILQERKLDFNHLSQMTRMYLKQRLKANLVYTLVLHILEEKI